MQHENEIRTALKAHTEASIALNSFHPSAESRSSAIVREREALEFVREVATRCGFVQTEKAGEVWVGEAGTIQILSMIRPGDSGKRINYTTPERRVAEQKATQIQRRINQIMDDLEA